MELTVILFVAVLPFGAPRLPMLARSSGQGTGEFRRGREAIGRERRETVDIGESTTERETVRPGSTAAFALSVVFPIRFRSPTRPHVRRWGHAGRGDSSHRKHGNEREGPDGPDADPHGRTGERGRFRYSRSCTSLHDRPHAVVRSTR